MEKKCPKCGYEGKVSHGRSKRVQIILFILGFLTAGLAWLILVIYWLFKPKYRCLKCNGRIY